MPTAEIVRDKGQYPIARPKPPMPPVGPEQIDEAISLVSNMWTDADIVRVFNVTANTVIVWRRERGLPFKVIQGDQRPMIRYVPSEVIRWGKRNGKTMNLSSK
jgi:hypothetical protein